MQHGPEPEFTEVQGLGLRCDMEPGFTEVQVLGFKCDIEPGFTEVQGLGLGTDLGLLTPGLYGEGLEVAVG